MKREAMGGPARASECVVFVLSAATLALTLAGWALMRFGLYTLGRAGLGALAIGAVAGYWVQRTRARSDARPSTLGWFVLAVGLAVGIALLHASFPTYFLLGGQDPGPYLTFAARIARTGGLDLRVPEFEGWARTHAGLYRPFPAVYGDLGAPDADAVHPQFVHLFTAYLASAWAAWGVEGAVRANAWIAALCLLTGFVYLRRLDSSTGALFFVVVLGFDPAFVWASRITLTECVALWLNLSGLALLLVAWDRSSTALASLGAFVLGLGILNRLDGGLGALAILGLAVAASMEKAHRRRLALVAALVHLAVCSFGYVDGERLAPNYFHDLNRLSGGDVTKLIVLTSALDLAACVIVSAPARLYQRLFLNETTVRLGGYALVLGLVVWVLFGVTLRPLGDDPETATTLLELTWYVGWAAWPLYFFGMVRALGPRSFQRFLPLVIFSAGSLFIYTSRTDVVHEHIWASRRWVPHTIPLLLAFAGIGVAALAGHLRRRSAAVAVVGLTGLCIVPAVLFDRPFLFRSMLAGLPAAYSRVAAYAREHRERWPLVTQSVQLGSILTYAYGVPTIVLNERGEEAAASGALEGAFAVGFNPFELHAPSGLDVRYSGPYLGRSVDEPPSEIVDLRVPLEAGFFGGAIYDLTIPAAHRSLRTRGTRRLPGGALLATGQRGPILWGPWTDLLAGRYRVEWYGRAESAKRKRRGTLDVIYAEGRETIAELPLEAEPGDGAERLLGGLDFELTSTTPGVEFRVRVDGRADVTLTRVRLQRF